MASAAHEPKRYRPCILATCCVPWNADFTFAEEAFRRQVRRLLDSGLEDLYIFGTAGEGYAVTERQFDEITQVFLEETNRPGIQCMVGLISLSLQTVIERIERSRAWGARRFQLSLPSWGALNDTELASFFRETCGRFPDCEFLHYNLSRAQRIISPQEYAALATEHHNLVATKNSTADVERLRGLLCDVPQLQHFITEPGFARAALMGECGLLVSVGSMNLQTCHSYFRAGRTQDAPSLSEFQTELHGVVAALKSAVGDAAHMDGAFDKMFCHVHDPEFPLRLLPPYASASEESCRRFLNVVREGFPRWDPQAEFGPLP